MINKIYGLLGLCTKAGDIVSGTDAVIESIETKKAKFIIVARRLFGKNYKKHKIYKQQE